MNTASPSPEELKKLQEFEEQALPLLPKLQAYARTEARGGYQSYVDDLVQETYMKAFKSWHTFEQGTNLLGWMKTILSNTLKNIQTKDNRSRHVASYDAMEEWQRDRNPQSVTSATTLAAEAEAISNMPAAVIVKAMNELNPDFRLVLEMTIVDGFTYAEVAEKLGVSPITVGTRLGRAKEALRAKLADYAAEQGYDVTPKSKSEKKKK